MIYSEYVLKKAKECKIEANFNENKFIVNGKYDLRLNRKTKRFMCTCKFSSDGKTKNKCCSHELGLFYHLDKKKYEDLTKC